MIVFCIVKQRSVAESLLVLLAHFRNLSPPQLPRARVVGVLPIRPLKDFGQIRRLCFSHISRHFCFANVSHVVLEID